MSWSYRIAKENVAGTTRYKLVEAFMNDQGEIWGYTNHTDILGHIQYDDYDDDEQVVDDIQTVLFRVLLDADKDIIDIDNFVAASSGFEEELKQIKKENEDGQI